MYQLFQQTMSPYLVFTIKDIKKEFQKFDNKALVYWQKKGYITKIRNRYYCFSGIEQNELFHFFAANKIFSPSYISLETALSYYNIIPEGVFTTFSITTLKTNTIRTPIGIFEYKHVKPKLFFAYQLITYKSQTVKIATLEKVVLDYIYLHSNITSVEDYIALRWNKEILKQMDFQLLEKYQLLFDSNALNKRVKQFLKYIHA